MSEGFGRTVWLRDAVDWGCAEDCCGNVRGSVSEPLGSPKKLSCVCADAIPLLTSVNSVFQFSSAAMCGMEPMKLGPLGALIVRLKVRVALEDAASVTLAIKLKLPPAVGVPEMAPELENDNPDGRVPDTKDQEYGVVPPLAESICV